MSTYPTPSLDSHYYLAFSAEHRFCSCTLDPKDAQPSSTSKFILSFRCIFKVYF